MKIPSCCNGKTNRLKDFLSANPLYQNSKLQVGAYFLDELQDNGLRVFLTPLYRFF
jgi:hypothetical protein